MIFNTIGKVTTVVLIASTLVGSAIYGISTVNKHFEKEVTVKELYRHPKTNEYLVIMENNDMYLWEADGWRTYPTKQPHFILKAVDNAKKHIELIEEKERLKGSPITSKINEQELLDLIEAHQEE